MQKRAQRERVCYVHFQQTNTLNMSLCVFFFVVVENQEKRLEVKGHSFKQQLQNKGKKELYGIKSFNPETANLNKMVKLDKVMLTRFNIQNQCSTPNPDIYCAISAMLLLNTISTNK